MSRSVYLLRQFGHIWWKMWFWNNEKNCDSKDQL